jgi:hypothetical protein
MRATDWLFTHMDDDIPEDGGKEGGAAQEKKEEVISEEEKQSKYELYGFINHEVCMYQRRRGL